MSDEKMRFSLALREAIRNLPRYGFDGTLGGDFGAHAAGPYVRRQDALAALVDLGARADALEAENVELSRRPSADTLNATARRLIAELNDDDNCDEDCKNCQARGMGYLHSELLQHLDGAATAPNEETKGATPCAGSN